MIDGKEMIAYDFCDISIAVSGPKGLMVPVIRNAENLSFQGIENEVKRLAIRARDGQITVDEMTGGTFTISNGGVFGSMLSTPIINPPQSATTIPRLPPSLKSPPNRGKLRLLTKRSTVDLEGVRRERIV
jgi:pyruvate/2-oxoglutarate dehydrogenase complex dihydrolipoamide acyltransferase (E2) component